MKKLVSLFLAAVLVVLACTGCGTKTGGEEKTANLVMYVVDDRPADYDLVQDELNKMLLEDINATVEVKFIPWSDSGKKIPMLLSSGEEFDLIYVGSINYDEFAKKGAFADITELAKEYAPKSLAALDEDTIKARTVDGRLYMLPASRKALQYNGLAIRGDLRKKYNVPEIRSLEDLMAFYKVIKEKEPNLMPYNAMNWDAIEMVEISGITGVPLYAPYADGEDPTELVSYVEQPGFLEKCKLLREGYVNGYWSKDVLVNKTPSKDSFINGTSATCGGVNYNNFVALYNEVVSAHPDWEPEFYVFESDKPRVVNAPVGMGICRTSKNPEKALQLLELLNTDERYFNLTTYGIEGKHWEYAEDGVHIQYPEGTDPETSGFKHDTAGNYGWRSEELFKYSVETPDGWEEGLNEMVEKSVYPPTIGFTPDVSEFKTEIALINEIDSKYNRAFYWGTVEDIEGTIATWKQELEDAGIEALRAEIKKQFKEYLNK